MSTEASQSAGIVQSASGRRFFSLDAWASHYDVIGELLPLECRVHDPIETLQTIKEDFESFPETKATYKTTEITPDYEAITGHDTFTLLNYLGSWRLVDRKRGIMWANPNYHSPHEIVTPNLSEIERVDLIRRAASIGILSMADISDWFAMTKQTLYKWLRKRGIQWGEWRNWGKARFARTAKMIREWGHHSLADIARAVDVPRTTIVGWVQSKADEFAVPDDPSTVHWISYGSQMKVEQPMDGKQILNKDHQRRDHKRGMEQFEFKKRGFWCEECGSKCTLGESGDEYGHKPTCSHAIGR